MSEVDYTNDVARLIAAYMSKYRMKTLVLKARQFDDEEAPFDMVWETVSLGIGRGAPETYPKRRKKRKEVE